MNATVLAAIIAAVAAVIAAALSIVTAVLTNRWQSESNSALQRLEQQFSDRQREIDYRRRQLNDFYGRVYMLRRQSESLRRLLPDKDGTGSRWRLVDHIIDIKNSGTEKQKQAVQMILNFDKEIAGLLTMNVGLYQEFPAPQSYTDFVQHYELLQLAWDQNQNQSEAERLPFPDQFDPDLNAAIEAVKGRLLELVTAETSSTQQPPGPATPPQQPPGPATPPQQPPGPATPPQQPPGPATPPQQPPGPAT
jgi:hypothetical protein